MSFFSIMNLVAWALCIVLALLLGIDFVKVEKRRMAENKRTNQ
jgi:hypothetical protein